MEETVEETTFGEKLKFVGVGCLRVILFLGIVVTQPVRWTLKLTIWPFIKLGRNIYCRIKFENKDKSTGEGNAEPEEASKKTGKSPGQKIWGVIKEIGMFVLGYLPSSARRVFILAPCELYNIARNKAFFGKDYCRMNSFCDGGFYKKDGKCLRRVDSHQGDNWGCSGNKHRFHLADYLRYISGYSDVLNKNFYRRNSIIRKVECCRLSKDSPEMYC